MQHLDPRGVRKQRAQGRAEEGTQGDCVDDVVVATAGDLDQARETLKGPEGGGGGPRGEGKILGVH